MSELRMPAAQIGPPGSWREVLLAFLRLGLTSFGGPSRISGISATSSSCAGAG